MVITAAHALLGALLAAAITAAAEMIHAGRTRRLARLAFPHGEKAATWTRTVPFLRVAGAAAVAWGLLTLLSLSPLLQERDKITVDSRPPKPDPQQSRHLLVLLDVSPSMGLEDAGQDGKSARYMRATEVLRSVLERIERKDLLCSLVAFYTEARPVLTESNDRDVLLNLMSCKLDIAFTPGKTDVVKGVEAAFDLAKLKKWPRASTTVLLITDGDTVALDKLPMKPEAVEQIIIAGVGSASGVFLDSHQSRQDANSLRQVASRYAAAYADTNQQLIPTALLGGLAQNPEKDSDLNFDRRFWGIALSLFGACLLAFSFPLLSLFGCRRPETAS
ncbi:MAG: hypothetical protein RL095_1375 [Verrucomicrobiota bacterium]|jgi:Ca-activated chloride channel family protein